MDLLLDHLYINLKFICISDIAYIEKIFPLEFIEYISSKSNIIILHSFYKNKSSSKKLLYIPELKNSYTFLFSEDIEPDIAIVCNITIIDFLNKYDEEYDYNKCEKSKIYKKIYKQLSLSSLIPIPLLYISGYFYNDDYIIDNLIFYIIDNDYEIDKTLIIKKIVDKYNNIYVNKYDLIYINIDIDNKYNLKNTIELINKSKSGYITKNTNIIINQ
jgi:hypothetical protein